MYIKGKFINTGDDLSDVNQVRTACKLGQLGQQDMATHVVAYCINEETRPVATAIIYFDGERYLIQDLCILPGEENKEYDDFIIKMLLYKAFENGADEVEAEVEKQNLLSYQKIGFEPAEPQNMEGETLHMCMKKINMHRCCENLEKEK